MTEPEQLDTSRAHLDEVVRSMRTAKYVNIDLGGYADIIEALSYERDNLQAALREIKEDVE